MEASSEYVPGVCNIGRTEAANRRRIGSVGAVVTVMAAVALAALHAHPALYALLTVPGFVAGTGFIQARQRFCAGYGAVGTSNFRDVLGASHTTTDAVELAADRARAKRITVQSALTGIAIAAAAATVAALLT